MKAFVATRKTQGKRPSDAMGCIDGELVWKIDPCPTSRRDPYGPCDCGRTFRGMYSDATTTTALVRDITGFTRDDYILALRACHDARTDCTCVFDPSSMVDELIAQAERLPEGAVVERCVQRLRVRDSS